MHKFTLNDYMMEPEEKVAKRVIYSDKNTLAFILNIAQEKSLPEHTHFDCTVFIQIISGKAEVNVDDEVIAMVENDLLQVDGDETMSVDNIGSTTLVLYVTISPLPPSEKYTENADF